MSRYRSQEVNETILVQARMGNKMMLQSFKKVKLKENLFWQILDQNQNICNLQSLV